MSQDVSGFHIKDWSPDDRPREKLQAKGAGALSNAELIAILIGAGTANLSAVAVAKNVLQEVNNNLGNLARLTVKDLMKVRGIGEARAVTIAASFELARRKKEGREEEKPKVTGSRDAFEYVAADLTDLAHEEFWVLLLNRANRITRKKKISEGGVSGTVVDPKIIFKFALEELATGIIVVHNHPSGNLAASQSDIDVTRKLKDASKFLEIHLFDHLIIAGRKYYSFADEGLL